MSCGLALMETGGEKGERREAKVPETPVCVPTLEVDGEDRAAKLAATRRWVRQRCVATKTPSNWHMMSATHLQRQTLVWWVLLRPPNHPKGVFAVRFARTVCWLERELAAAGAMEINIPIRHSIFVPCLIKFSTRISFQVL